MARWLIDFDEVLCDLTGAFVREVNRRTGAALTKADVDTWDYFRQDPRHEAIVWAECYHDERFLMRRCKRVPDSRLFVKTLIAGKQEPVIVTARHPRMQRWVENWLVFHGYPWPLPVICTGHGVSKARVAFDYGLTIAVDDAPHNVVDFCDAPWIERVMMPATPYNREVPDHPKLMRFETYPELLGKFRAMSDTAREMQS